MGQLHVEADIVVVSPRGAVPDRDGGNKWRAINLTLIYHGIPGKRLKHGCGGVR